MRPFLNQLSTTLFLLAPFAAAQTSTTDPILEKLPADATNVLVIRDPIPFLVAMLESPRMEALTGRLATMAELPDELRSFAHQLQTLQEQMGLSSDFVPREVVVALTPPTMHSLVHAAQVAMLAAILPMLRGKEGVDAAAIEELDQAVQASLAAIDAAEGMGWLWMRNEPAAKGLFDKAVSTFEDMPQGEGLEVDVQGSQLLVRAQPLHISGGKLAQQLTLCGFDPSAAAVTIELVLEHDGEWLHARAGTPSSESLATADLGPLWRPSSDQLAFAHFDWEAGYYEAIELLQRLSSAIGATPDEVIDGSEDSSSIDQAETLLLRLLPRVDGLTDSVYPDSAMSLELVDGIKFTTDRGLGGKPNEFPVPPPEVVRCFAPEEGPLMLSAGTLDAVLSGLTDELVSGLMQRADNEVAMAALRVMFNQFGDAMDYIDGEESELFDPGFAIVTRAIPFGGSREPGSDESRGEELPFGAVAILAVGRDQASAMQFVDRLAELVEAGFDLPQGSLLKQAQLGFGGTTKRLSWRALVGDNLPELADGFDPHFCVQGRYLLLSTDAQLTKDVFGRIDDDARSLELPSDTAISWVRLRGPESDAILAGVAAWLREFGEAGDSVASLGPALEVLAAAAAQVDTFETFDAIVGDIYRRIYELRLREVAEAK